MAQKTLKLKPKIKDARLTSRLGYEFKDLKLLERALTHRSVNSKNYERLEFLGDSLLSVIITQQLYHTYQNEDEGRLTRMRATLVRQETLAKIAKDLQLSSSLILSVGELKSGGHNRESILADVVEAIIAAIYLDSQDLALLNSLVLKWYQPYLNDLAEPEQLKDPKTRLQEYLQARKKALPVYEVLHIQGDAPNQVFTVQCTVEDVPVYKAKGSSRRFAEQSAAAEILQYLESNNDRK